MTLQKRAGGWAIVISLIVAFALMALPLPAWAHLWRPAWVTLALIYWCIAVPQRVGVGVGWTLGLLLDVMTGTLLGQHAMALTMVAYLSLKFHLRIRMLPLWHQGFSVFLLVLLDQSLAAWVRGIQGHSIPAGAVLAPAVTSTLLWPWVFVILRDVRRKHQVS